jgi:esterase
MSLKLAQRFQVWAIDQRNHGRSPHSPEMDYRVMAADLAELMAAHGLERAAVLGHSMGGKTAMQFALDFPARVERLIVVDIAPRQYAPQHDQIFAGLLALNPATSQTRTEMETALAPWIPERGLRQFLLKNLTRDAEGHFRWRIGLHEIHQNYTRLGEPVSGQAPSYLPALFVRGEESSYLQDTDLPLIRHLFPKAELCSVPRAGHLVHTDNPEGFQCCLEDFLLRPEA